MIFLNFLRGPEECLGILYKGDLKNDEGLFILPLADCEIFAKDMNELLINFKKYEDKIRELKEHKDLSKIIKISKKDLLAPIPEPRQDIICLGLNFLDHAKESAKFKKEHFERPEAPVYFGKRCNRATGPFEKIKLHEQVTKELDYECELALILSKDAFKIKAKDAKNYIFGYTIINDLSARDLQKKHKQFYRAKSLEGSTVMGPWIVSTDEFSYPPCLDLKTYVNGELRQDSNTRNFIFDIAYVLEELSAGMLLKAGSIISMGTPSGVGMGLNPPRFLRSGDTVCCEIEGIGILENKVS